MQNIHGFGLGSPEATVPSERGALGSALGPLAGVSTRAPVSLNPLAPPAGCPTPEPHEPSRGGRLFRLVPVGHAPEPATDDERSCATHSPHLQDPPPTGAASGGREGVHGRRGSLGLRPSPAVCTQTAEFGVHGTQRRFGPFEAQTRCSDAAAENIFHKMESSLVPCEPNPAVAQLQRGENWNGGLLVPSSLFNSGLELVGSVCQFGESNIPPCVDFLRGVSTCKFGNAGNAVCLRVPKFSSCMHS